VERRRLGRLEHESSVLIYGAFALGRVTQDVADKSIQRALDAGINHFDVAADYDDAELRLGPLMPRIRDDIFLATKTGQRAREDAWREINRSLERLQTDHLDLLQLHAIGDLDELDKATGSGGALEAALRARDEGMTAAIGITGHGIDAPATHLEALRRFPFATVLTPLSVALSRDERYLRSYEELVTEVAAQDAGLMIIKSVARRNWPEQAKKRYGTWYEPLDEQRLVTAAVSWVLGHDEVTGIATPGDVRLLDLVIRAEADRMDPLDAGALLSDEPTYSSPFISMPED
jgi:aryl-alcohol dehydrogenase-like predicted oxidoreductase